MPRTMDMCRQGKILLECRDAMGILVSNNRILRQIQLWVELDCKFLKLIPSISIFIPPQKEANAIGNMEAFAIDQYAECHVNFLKWIWTASAWIMSWRSGTMTKWDKANIILLRKSWLSSLVPMLLSKMYFFQTFTCWYGRSSSVCWGVVALTPLNDMAAAAIAAAMLKY